MTEYQALVGPIEHKHCCKMGLYCNLEHCSIWYNCCTSLGVIALIVFMFGSSAWCANSDDPWCLAFAGELGVLYSFLLLIGLCCSPCFFDCFVSMVSRTGTRFKEYPFDSRYTNIHQHTFIANDECVKNNLSANDMDNDNDNDINNNNNNTFKTEIAYKIPIIYSSKYNITAWGIEKIHPFDSQKYRRIYDFLINENTLSSSQIIEPPCASRADLLTVHTTRYLSTLTSSWMIMKILELPGLCLLPAPILFWRALCPMMYQCGGTILGVEFAYKYGWCINLGGGFHHASSTQGGGFCVYADITMAIKYIRTSLKDISFRGCRILIIDLDAHQGNGHERDCKDFFVNDNNLRVLDGFNAQIYPNDNYAKNAIDYKMTLGIGCGTEYFIGKLNEILNEAMDEFKPQFIIYNAGTDCLEGDPLGAMNISPDGIIERDEIVFNVSIQSNIPILMVLSGGYQMNNARVIADSIQNLKRKHLLLMKK